MHHRYHRLMALLDEEADLYQDLLVCVQKEKQAVVEMDFDRLGELGRLKEQMLLKQQCMGRARDNVLNEFRNDLEVATGELTLGRLSQHAPPPYDDALQRRRKRLRRLVTSLGAENDHVQQLVHHGLSLVRGSYQLITQLLDANPVYHSTGNLQPAASTGKLHRGDY